MVIFESIREVIRDGIGVGEEVSEGPFDPGLQFRPFTGRIKSLGVDGFKQFEGDQDSAVQVGLDGIRAIEGAEFPFDLGAEPAVAVGGENQVHVLLSHVSFFKSCDEEA